MPNQFQTKGSLQEKMESRYNMPFKESMKMLAQSGMSRSKIAEEFSFSHANVVKHSLRLGVGFKSSNNLDSKKKHKDNLIKIEFHKQLKNQQLTSINVLSKKWCIFNG